MKTMTVVTVLALLACATTVSPEQRWASAATVYVSTLQALTQLKTAGVIDDEDKARIEPYRVAARAALDEMEKAIATEDSSAFQVAWDAFSAAIDVMLREKAKANVEVQE